MTLRAIEADRTRRCVTSIRAATLTAIAVLLVAVVAIFALDLSAGHVDAHTVRAWSARTSRLNVSAYTGGANQRGPLWTAAFMAALHVNDGAAYWAVIAAMEIFVSTVAALSIAFLAFARSRVVSAAVAGGVAAWSYLLLGGEEFSATLFSRNISGSLTAASSAALCASLWSGARRPNLLTAISGILIGLALQTMPTTVVTAAVLGTALVLVVGFEQRAARAVIARVAVWGGAALGATASAPLYYLVRGDFSNFWNLYWRYNQIYAKATTRSMTDQLGITLATYRDYYSTHPVYVVCIIGFLVVSVTGWREASLRRRCFDVALMAWWVAEMTSVALSQRFFGHYFVLPFLPVALMGTCVLGETALALRPAARHLLPVTAVLVLVLGPGSPTVALGLREASAFRGADAYRDRAFLRLPADRRAQRALVEVMSTDEDYLQVWSHWTGFYDELDRTAATRYNALNWFVGTVYGSPSPNPAYILPGTFERWQEDVRRTPPRLFLIGPGSFDAAIPEMPDEIAGYVDAHMEKMFDGFNGSLYVDRETTADLRRILSLRGAPANASRVPRTGATGGRVAAAPEPLAPGDLRLADGTTECELLSVTVTRDPTPDATVVVQWNSTEVVEQPRVAVASERSRSERLFEDGAVTEAETAIPLMPNSEPRLLQVLVVNRNAAVLLDGRVVGMIATTASKASIAFSSTNGAVTLSDVTRRILGPEEWRPCAAD